MGWLFTQGQTRSELIYRLCATEENEHGRWTTLKHACVGNCLWRVLEWVDKDKGITAVLIALDLLQSQRGYGWGYKSMSESMGPNYYNCPLALLDLVPEPPSKYAADWRRKVRQAHAAQAKARGFEKSLKVGDALPLLGCKVPFVNITALNPLVGEYRGTF
jgi:hypothetical protein